jgi:hypothetical protein
MYVKKKPKKTNRNFVILLFPLPGLLAAKESSIQQVHTRNSLCCLIMVCTVLFSVRIYFVVFPKNDYFVVFPKK